MSSMEERRYLQYLHVVGNANALADKTFGSAILADFVGRCAAATPSTTLWDRAYPVVLPADKERLGAILVRSRCADRAAIAREWTVESALPRRDRRYF